MSRSRARSVLLATLTLLFGLHIFRVFVPILSWYLGKYLSAEQLALYALVTFALTLLAPLVRRLLGERGALALTAGGLALVRLAIQLAEAPPTDLALATAGLVLWGWFVPLWHQSLRNCPGEGDAPVLAVAFPLAFILDVGSRSLLLFDDLAWRLGLWARLTVAGLAALALLLLWRELADRSLGEAADEPSLGRVWPLVGLGPWLYLALALVHNPSMWETVLGQSNSRMYAGAGSGVAVLSFTCVWIAGRRRERHSWLWALLNGGLLVGALALRVVGIELGGLWLIVVALTLWPALGWVLGDTARTKPLHSGLWRTTWATFVALLLLLLVVFLVSEFNLFWMTVAGGAILALAAIWSSLSGEEVRPDAEMPRSRAYSLVLIVGAVVLVIVLLGTSIRSPETVESPSTDHPLRVMIYNIHHGIDADMRMNLEAIADAIAAENPDVIALNEVNRGRATNGFVDTLPLISRRLGMPYVFGANYPDGLYGNAILSRYPILEWDNTHYTRNTTEIRGLLRVVVDAPGGPITFYATHLDHIKDPHNARAEQVAEALVLWNGTPRSILLGDLNAEPDKPELQAIYEAGFVDALAAAGQDQVFTFWDPIPTPGRRIDFIFTTPDLALGQAWVVQTRASDHLPVLAEVGP